MSETIEKYVDNVILSDSDNIEHLKLNKKVICNNKIEFVEKQSPKDKSTTPLAAAVVGINNTAIPLPNGDNYFNCWTDADAQELYLKSKPTCYLILGKPGVGAYSLGEAISKKQNCIHLCPRNIIIDEIEQNSSTGICLSHNLKCSNIIKYDPIWAMLKTKLDSKAVKHRGYVLSGFPLVPTSESELVYTESLISEEAFLVVSDFINIDLLDALKKKKSKKHTEDVENENVDMEEIEEEQEPEMNEEEDEEKPVVLPKFVLDSCLDIINKKKSHYRTKKTVMLQQLFNIFDIELIPDIVIYVTCPDKDVVTKKSNKFLNYLTGSLTAKPFQTLSVPDSQWPTTYTLSDCTKPYDTHIFNPKYCCKQPMNFTKNSTTQLCNYENYVLLYIEKKLTDFKPNFTIKLDGRTSVYKMMYHLNERLQMLPIKPVLIPQPLYLEELPEDLETFWTLIEDLNSMKSGVIQFNKYPSLWYNRCPVELKHRKSVIGNPKFAVTFFKHVYLLSSLENMILFCRNPRPYLNVCFLEPTCRIIVTGLKSSGKTMVSKCLSWIFDAPIISFNDLYVEEKNRKYNMYSKTILSEIIATIEDARYIQWQTKESQRLEGLRDWNLKALEMLNTYISLLEVHKSNKEVKDETLLNKMYAMSNKLAVLPFINDITICKSELRNGNLTQYAPKSLTNETAKPTIPMLGDNDVVLAISNYIIANELHTDILPNYEEIVTEIVKRIYAIDIVSQRLTNVEQKFGKYIIDGFPSDPEYWRNLSDAKYLPDYTIALIDNREISLDLFKDYINIERRNIKDYQERFLLAKDPLIQIKLEVTKLLETNMLDMQIIIDELLLQVFDTITHKEKGNDEETESDLFKKFGGDVDKFREEWDSVKVNLEEYQKPFVEIDLESKSDVDVVEEVLLMMRRSYFLSCEPGNDDIVEDEESDTDLPHNNLVYNNSKYLGETNIYCPVCFYDFGVLWPGQAEYCIKHNNKVYNFSTEKCMTIFQKDVTKYQAYNKPFKSYPPRRICVIGCIGSGKSTVSKIIAKELGLIHIDFVEFLNSFVLPKHFKKVGVKYENCFKDQSVDEDAVVEFQMDEEHQNLEADMLSNEDGIRRMLYNYLERGTPMLPLLMHKLLKKIWFNDPFLRTGFVLDGYPRLPSDVEDMTMLFCIPDIIIEIEGNSDTAISRLSPTMFDTWKNHLNEAKLSAKSKFYLEKQQWTDFITKNVIGKLLCEELLDAVCVSMEEPINKLSSTESLNAYSAGFANVEIRLMTFYNDMIKEFPQPEDKSAWEKPSDALEGINSRIESIYEVDDENIQTLKDVLIEQRIKTISVDGTTRLQKLLSKVLLKLSYLRRRSESFFEQTFVINYDVAEMLLSDGFYFLSKFYRICPVYIHENPKTVIVPYKAYKNNGKIFAVLHRCYVFFLYGENAVEKFRFNPLKYILSSAINSYIQYPLRIGIIGPPKCGKTTLASKLAKKYGFLCVSKGKALRNILTEFSWTELASLIRKSILSGECVNLQQIIKAVQTSCIDYRTDAYGLILDGIPELPSEACELINHGLYPTLVLDLSSTMDKCLKNSLNEVYLEILKYVPHYSHSLIVTRYSQWKSNAASIRDWIKNDIQNLYTLNGIATKLQNVNDAQNVIDNIIKDINYYISNVSSTIVPAGAMGISEEYFQNKMSSYKNLCPMCFHNNEIRHSSFPVDRKGIVQYMDTFYWICEDHMNLVLTNPELYLHNDKINIPELPAVIKHVDHALIYENGICVVSYAKSLPALNLADGREELAVNYKGKIYLFCTPVCQSIFMRKPHLYCDIVILKNTKSFPSINLKTLPNIGYLEQTVGNLLTEACCAVNVFRPKYPGLSKSQSASIYLALYLKTHATDVDEQRLANYYKAFKVFKARCRLINDLCLRLRSIDNPFAKYPKCCNRSRNKYKSICGSSTSKSSVSCSDVDIVTSCL